MRRAVCSIWHLQVLLEGVGGRKAFPMLLMLLFLCQEVNCSQQANSAFLNQLPEAKSFFKQKATGAFLSCYHSPGSARETFHRCLTPQLLLGESPQLILARWELRAVSKPHVAVPYRRTPSATPRSPQS